MRDGLSADGTLYAAPSIYGESSMVMYRKDLTDAGVTIADNDPLGKTSLRLPLRCTTQKMTSMAFFAVSQVGGDGTVSTVANSFGALGLMLTCVQH
jgi:sorbitol/mannitol transport system substrate-binding protein